MSEEEQFLNERAAINHGSYARASKEKYLHQQKMLKKHEENVRKGIDGPKIKKEVKKPLSKKRDINYNGQASLSTIATINTMQ